jgi:preprotein translocase subunit SecE
LLSERLKALKEAQQVNTPGEAGKAAATAQTPAASNPFTAAAEESRLIAWPAVSNVLGSTAAVLGIVVASTLLILAVNSLLATASERLFG